MSGSDSGTIEEDELNGSELIKQPAADSSSEDNGESSQTSYYYDPPEILNARVNAVGRLLSNESQKNSYLKDRQLLPDQNSHQTYSPSQVNSVIQTCFDEMINAAKRMGVKGNAVIPSPSAIITVSQLLASPRYNKRWPAGVKTRLHTKLTNRKHYYVREMKKRVKKDAAPIDPSSPTVAATSKFPVNKNRRQLNCFPSPAAMNHAAVITQVRSDAFDAAQLKFSPPLRRNIFGMMVPMQQTPPDITPVCDYFVSRNPDNSLTVPDAEVYCQNFPYIHRFFEETPITTILKTPAVPPLTSTTMYDIHFSISVDSKLSYGVLGPFKQRLAVYVPHIHALFGTTEPVCRNMLERISEGYNGLSIPPEWNLLCLVAQYFEETTEAFILVPLCPTGIGPYNAMAKCPVPHVIVGEYADNIVLRYKVFVNGEKLKETNDIATALFFWSTSWFIFNSQTERFPKNESVGGVATSLKRAPANAGKKGKPTSGDEDKKKEKVVRMSVTNTVYFFAHQFLAVWNNHDSSVKQKDRNKIEMLISRFSKVQTRLAVIPEKVYRSEESTKLSFL